MNIKIDKKYLEEIMDILYIECDDARENSDDNRADNLQRILFEFLIHQYREQLEKL